MAGRAVSDSRSETGDVSGESTDTSSPTDTFGSIESWLRELDADALSEVDREAYRRLFSIGC